MHLSPPFPMSTVLPPYNRPGIAFPMEKCMRSTSYPLQVLFVQVSFPSSQPPILRKTGIVLLV